MICVQPTLRPLAAALALVSLHSVAYSQAESAAQPAEQPTAQEPVSASGPAQGGPSAADMLDLHTVVVTGRGRDRAKFTSSYSVSTFSEQELGKRGPLSVAALITQVPGLFAESSGGEIGNNVYSRGLPNDNYRYLPLLEDGLPVFEEGAGAFTNADTFFRFDATTRNVQVVRGGTASILANNAPGGSVNVITKKGTETLQGQIKLEAGDYDHYRADFNVSGPINDKVLFQAGGFQRINNGMRDPGFNGNKGGQLRGGLTFKLDDGQLYLGLRKLNDHNIFYTAMPMASASQGLPGLSAQRGTLVSEAFSNLTVPDGQGAFNTPFNIKNGVHTNITTFTALFDKDLSDTVSIHNKFRRTSGKIDFNGLFSNGTADAQGFLDSALPALKAANPATASAAYRLAGGKGDYFGAAQMPNGLALTEGVWNTLADVNNVINDFSVKKSLSTGLGTHDLVAGVYFSQFKQQQAWNWNDVLTMAANRPPLLDVVGLDASGRPTVSRTTNGLLNLHTNLQHFTDHVRNIDYYLTDTWQVTKPLSIDGGIRYHTVKKHGLVAQTTNKNLGDPSTVADDSVAVFNGASTPYSFDTRQWAASVGANYELSEAVAVFARGGKSFRVTPEFAQWFNCCTPVENNIKLLELGLKYATREYSAFVTLYRNDFPNLSFNTTTTVNGQQVTQSASASAKSTGLEAELVWRPSSRFDLAASGVYQGLKYSGFSGIGANGAPFNYSGNQIIRQPKVQLSLRPTLHFGAANAYSIYADYRYTGKRYADVANTTALPAYGELDLGLAADLNAKTRFTLIATNVLNKVGVTEGNPRSGIIQGAPQTAFEGRPIFGRHIRASIEYKF
jgi:outer membrane receptor protein involved in Fe transport